MRSRHPSPAGGGVPGQRREENCLDEPQLKSEQGVNTARNMFTADDWPEHKGIILSAW